MISTWLPPWGDPLHVKLNRFYWATDDYCLHISWVYIIFTFHKSAIYLFLSKIILTILTHCFREHCLCKSCQDFDWAVMWKLQNLQTDTKHCEIPVCTEKEEEMDMLCNKHMMESCYLHLCCIYILFWVAALGLPTGSVHILPWGLWAGPRIWALQTTAPV